MQFSLYAGGLESFVDSSAETDEEPTAGLSLHLFDVLLRPVEFFRGSSELMSAVWSAPSEPVSALAVSTKYFKLTLVGFYCEPFSDSKTFFVDAVTFYLNGIIPLFKMK